MVDGVEYKQEERLQQQNKLASFEKAVLPHRDAAYNVARWLTRNDADAEDVVQEAYLRAFRFFSGFHGQDARAWLLAIVRNTCYTWLKQHRAQGPATSCEGELDSPIHETGGPEQAVPQRADRSVLRVSLEDLPVELREGLI